MGNKLKWRTIDDKGVTSVALFGVMDEDADFSALDLSEAKEVHFGFEKITGINSCGLKEWVQFLRGLPDEGVKYVFLNCHPPILDQINMSYGFAKRGTEIRSFYVGFYCDECEAEKEVGITTKEMESNGIPETRCEQCGGVMDYEEDIYDYDHLRKVG